MYLSFHFIEFLKFLIFKWYLNIKILFLEKHQLLKIY
jgi:hypothetical protein